MRLVAAIARHTPPINSVFLKEKGGRTLFALRNNPARTETTPHGQISARAGEYLCNIPPGGCPSENAPLKHPLISFRLPSSPVHHLSSPRTGEIQNNFVILSAGSGLALSFLLSASGVSSEARKRRQAPQTREATRGAKMQKKTTIPKTLAHRILFIRRLVCSFTNTTHTRIDL